MKCSECKNCKLDINSIGNAQARCELKAPPKQGKIITWACTSYSSLFDASIGRVHEHGQHRVKETLRNKKQAPEWCPLENKA